MTDVAMTQSEPVRKRQLKFLDELEAFADSTTLHGVTYALKQNAFVVRRIIWAVLVVASVAACLWQVSFAVNQYLQYDTVNSIVTKKHETMAFPAITVCNVNKVRKSYAEALGAPATQLLQAALFEKSRSIRSGVVQQDGSDTEASEADLNVIADAVNSTFYEYVRDAASQAEGTFLLCLQNGYFPCLPYVTPVVSLLGMCYTFNAKDRLPVRQTIDGPERGLGLALNVDTDEYFAPFARDAVGLRIRIHDPDDFPQIDSGDILLAPGTDVNLSLQKKVFYNLKKPYSEVDCNDDPGYSYAICRSECARRQVLTCGNCTIGSDSDAPCSFLQGFRCYVRNYNLWFSSHNQCDCPNQCRVTRYEHKISTGAYPTPFAYQIYSTLPNWRYNSTESFHRNMMFLTVYYETLTTEEIYEQPLVNQWQLFSTVGGLMGLFIGCSTMTLFEFPDFLIVFLRKKLRNRHVKVEDNVTRIEVHEPTEDYIKATDQ